MRSAPNESTSGGATQSRVGEKRMACRWTTGRRWARVHAVRFSHRPAASRPGAGRLVR